MYKGMAGMEIKSSDLCELIAWVGIKIKSSDLCELIALTPHFFFLGNASFSPVQQSTQYFLAETDAFHATTSVTNKLLTRYLYFLETTSFWGPPPNSRWGQLSAASAGIPLVSHHNVCNVYNVSLGVPVGGTGRAVLAAGWAVGGSQCPF